MFNKICSLYAVQIVALYRAFDLSTLMIINNAAVDARIQLNIRCVIEQSLFDWMGGGCFVCPKFIRRTFSATGLLPE